MDIANIARVWEQRKLGEIVEFYSGLTYSPDNISEHGVLVLRSSNIQNDKLSFRDNVYVENTCAVSESVKLGDIIVVVRNGSRSLIGKHAIIDFPISNTVIGAFMTGLRYQVPNFMNCLLSTERFNKEIEKNMGATINQITTGSFKKMQFYFSKDIKEQKRIGQFFEKLDKLITLHQRK
ncbi:restriction endonuclease subunit S [Enterococcus sp.]|uniref:restriction endonuclease subunit S n=1 Tax=Enterococcus sp. TaxID=35783 RepID=UPI0033906A6C